MASQLIRVEIDEGQRRVTVTRTAAPVASEADVAAMIEEARDALAAVTRAGYVVTIDLREAPLAVESRYADAFAGLRRELVRGFRRAAFLVETKVGLLQVQRLVREERLAAIVVDSVNGVERHFKS